MILKVSCTISITTRDVYSFTISCCFFTSVPPVGEPAALDVHVSPEDGTSQSQNMQSCKLYRSRETIIDKLFALTIITSIDLFHLLQQTIPFKRITHTWRSFK